MAQAVNEMNMKDTISRSGEKVSSSPSRQAYQILHLGFTVAPIVAGADKFFTFWSIGINIRRRLSIIRQAVTDTN